MNEVLKTRARDYYVYCDGGQLATGLQTIVNTFKTANPAAVIHDIELTPCPPINSVLQIHNLSAATGADLDTAFQDWLTSNPANIIIRSSLTGVAGAYVMIIEHVSGSSALRFNMAIGYYLNQGI